MKSALLIRGGRLLFGISLVAFGLLHFLYGDFVTRVVPSWPSWLPPRPLWVIVVGAALVAAGLSTLTALKTRPVLLALGGGLVVSLACLHLPAVVRDAAIGGAWTSFGKALVLCGGCLAVASTCSDQRPRWSAIAFLDRGRALALGRRTFALFLLLAGAQHLRWTEFVATLVPAWIPGGATVWTYVSAALLISGGLGMLIPRWARVATLASGLMIFLWVFMVHLPRVLHGDGSPPNEATSLFEALACAGLAFFYAATPVHERD